MIPARVENKSILFRNKPYVQRDIKWLKKGMFRLTQDLGRMSGSLFRLRQTLMVQVKYDR